MAEQKREAVGEDLLLVNPQEAVENEEKTRQEKTSGSDAEEDETELRMVDWREAADRFTPAVVDALLEEAEADALNQHGRLGSAAASSSQTEFHTALRGIVQVFLQEPLSGKTVGDLGDVICQALEIGTFASSCRPRPTAGSKNLFPLPAKTCTKHLPGVSKFLPAVAWALNDLNGVMEPGDMPMTSTASRALKSIAAVLEESEILKEPLPEMNFKEFLSHRKLDYQGDEIKIARKMTWESISLSLPDEVGQLHLRDFCEGGVLHFIDNFTDHLVPVPDQYLGRTPNVMVDPSEWPKVAEGLVTKGICSIVGESCLHHIAGRPLLNGMFSVSKQEFKGTIEVCRLIMNLKPLNANSMSLMGDTGTLPSATSLGHMFLEESQVLLTCSEDIRCFFYLFRVPEAWKPFLAFGLEAPPQLIPEHLKGQRCYLTSQVLPMGYLNSVGVAQHIHRNVVRMSLGSLQGPLGGEHELRRDKPFSQSDVLFRIYLDNFDLLTKTDKVLAETLEGSVGDVVQGLREAYLEGGLPRHPKKCVQNQPKAEVQGAWVDGLKGTVCAKPGKVARYVALTLELLVSGMASQRELQVVGGGMVYVAMFRRPLLSSLNHIWTMITDMEGTGVNERWSLRKEVACELVRFLGLLPLSFMNMRLGFDPVVTASDASTQGGGICVSRGLSPFGGAAASAAVRGDLPEMHDFYQILSVGLFDGISALRVALDVLQLPVAGHISVEKSPEARRVVEAAFPDTIFVDDVTAVTAELCRVWALKFGAVVVILVGAGPPCQGVSGLNCDRKGALRDSRSSLFREVPRIVELLRQAFPWAQVHFLAENVSSMDYDDCSVMNEGYQTLPWFIDASGITPCHRPRLYWLSWEPHEGEGARLWEGSTGQLPVQGEVELLAKVSVSDFLEPGWNKLSEKPFPTFTTSRPSSVPLRRPAGLKTCASHEKDRWQQDCHRFPPYQYRDENCLGNSSGEVRPPSIKEREVMLGFPVDFTRQCMAKSFHDSVAHKDCRLSLLGNSWSVPVISWLLSCLFSLLGLMEPVSLQEIVDRTTPGRHFVLQSLLLRPPLSKSTKTLPSSQVLVRKLCGLVSLKGEDILLQSATDIPVRYHRLRSSIPAALWRWKDVAGWRWCGSPEHINVLELRSVLTTVKWRVEQLQQNSIRCVHLVDSLVVLHALTRGRSSSRKMKRTMMRICSYLLCSGLQPVWAYVDTKQNPADRPSRRFVKKKWLKRS